MMSGLVNASFSLPEWQAVKMILFAPWWVFKKKKYSQSPLYGHLIITGILLCPWGKKALTFYLNSTGPLSVLINGVWLYSEWVFALCQSLQTPPGGK